MKHPINIPGWEGNLEGLAKAIENLRYDKLHLFLGYLAQAVLDRAHADWNAKKSKLSFKLYDAYSGIKVATDHVLKAWAICQKHMDTSDKEDEEA